MSLSEETITETCLFSIARRHVGGPVTVIPATKPQEAIHGADWEWWFTHNGQGVGYRVQAKRLFPSGRYESLFKPKDKFGQLQKLVSNATTDGLDPLYCFYNHNSPAGVFDSRTNLCHHDYRGPSFWGCSLAIPQDVELVGEDTVKDLANYQEPWHRLVCSNGAGSLPSAAIANVQLMARSRTATGGSRRPAVEVARTVRALPDYVHRLIGLGRERRPELFLDFEFWNDETAEGRDVSGVLVFDQRT